MEHDTPLLVSVSSRGWKKAQRVSQNEEPLIWKAPPMNDIPRETAAKPCAVCMKNQSRYLCPRCQIPYCSVTCYRDHSSETVNSTEGTGQCSETFFKEKVNSAMRLEALEHTDDTQKILARYSEQQKDGEDEGFLQEIELYQLLEALELGGDLYENELMSKVSPSLRASFLQDVQSGKAQELALEHWYPWWRRDLGGSGPSDGNRTPAVVPQSDTTLDERLLNVPAFATLAPQSHSQPNLIYNSLEIMYGICWTLRLYHGPRNVTSGRMAVDAAQSLLSSCSVLSSKTTLYSSLEEVLSSCAARSTQQYPMGCNTEWEILMDDVGYLVASHRLVGRAILEAIDIFKAAIKDSRPKQNSNAQVPNNDEDEQMQKEFVIKLRQTRKKLEFYVSWSQSAAHWGKSLQNDIDAWQNSWTPPSTNTSDMILTDLKIPE